MSDAFLRQLGGSCQIDYKLHFWCTSEGALPCMQKAKGFVEHSFKVTLLGLRKAL